jgi:hypothetical protein
MSESKPKGGHDAKLVVVSGGPSSPNKKKFRSIGLILTCVLLIVIGLVIFRYFKDKNVTSSSTVCSNTSNSPILKQAANALNKGNIDNLKQSIDQIQGLTNYQKYPSCLYPIVNYYINIGNINQASLYLGKLNNVYNPKNRYNPLFGYDARSPAVLSAEITFMKNSIQQTEQNERALSIQ